MNGMGSTIRQGVSQCPLLQDDAWLPQNLAPWAALLLGCLVLYFGLDSVHVHPDHGAVYFQPA